MLLTVWKAALAFSLGILVGLALGFVAGWKVWPVRYVNVTPAELATSTRGDYVLMISASFAQTGDLATAIERLTALGYGLADVQSLAAEGPKQGLSPHQVDLLNRFAAALAAEIQSDMKSPTSSPLPDTRPSSRADPSIQLCFAHAMATHGHAEILSPG